ncbi:MAG TPA: hypothetical protein VFA65_20465 [Bryobacteraceae bacterium]|nr:hypothetical protein [Bryobacteraceae bacterium]
MIEFLKTLGSFLGLFTSAVFFYDRMAKGFPIGSLTIEEETGRKLACIRISNPSDYDIAILSSTVKPDIYFLSEKMDVRNLVGGAAGHSPYFMLKPKESKLLIIVPKFAGSMALELKPQSVKFRFSWRRCNATWMPQWPLHICTHTQTIRKYGLEKI